MSKDTRFTKVDHISPNFGDHIRGIAKGFERPKKTVGPYGDRCKDPLDEKPPRRGIIIAGSAEARVYKPEPGVFSPFELMQFALHRSGGKKVVVEDHLHGHCGRLALKHDAVTPEAQARVRNSVRGHFEAAYRTLARSSPADAKRVVLIHTVGERGSNPTYRKHKNGRIEIANPDFLKDPDKVKHLTPDFFDRLIKEQQELILRLLGKGR